MGVSMKSESWFTRYTFVGDDVEKVWALDAFSSGPEWFVSGAEDSDLVLVFVFFPVISC
jgi:hypothetical protein